MSKAVGLPAVLVADKAVASSPTVGLIVDARTDMSTRGVANTRTNVVLLTAKLSDLEDVRDVAEREDESLVKKTQTVIKTSEDYVIDRRDGALCRYHGVWRSVPSIVKAAVECSAALTNTLAQMRLLLEERCKAKAVSSSDDPSQKEVRVAELESALDKNNCSCKRFFGHFAENFALHTKSIRLTDSVETFDRVKMKMVVLTQHVRDLVAHFKNFGRCLNFEEA